MYKAIKRVGRPFQGFFIGKNLMVSVGQRGTWEGVQAGLKPLDKVLTVNNVELKSTEQFQLLINKGKIDEPYYYKIERGDEILTIAVPIKKISPWDFLISFLAPFSIGLIFITLGALTIFYVPDLRVSYLYFVFCSLIGIFCIVLFESYTSHTFFRFTQIYPLIAAVAVHIFAIFKEEKKISDSRAFIIISIYVVAILLVALREYFLFNQDVTIVLSKVSSFFVAFTLLINLGLIIDNLITAKTNIAKDRAKVLLAGVLIASSAVGLWSTNFIFKRALFQLDEAILLSLIFPIFMTYAILKKNIFDIDRVIRMSLTYGLSTGIVILSYFIIMTMVGFIWPGAMQPEGLIGIFAFMAIIGAFIYRPLIKKVRILIYKILFKSKYDRLQTLMNFSKRLSADIHIDGISRLLVKDLVDLMELKGACLLTYISETEDYPHIQMSNGLDEKNINLTRFEKSNSTLMKILNSSDKPQFLGELRNMWTKKDIDDLKHLGVKLLMPIKSKGELLGILFLLDKWSGDIFTSEDIEFLNVLSNQSAITLENAKLYTEKARQERLAALGEVASVIIHEIKNPLGVIKVSSGTIKRKLAKDTEGHELAGFIEKEVDRMNSTIQQILNFSKPKENRLSEFSLDQLISNILREMEYLKKEKEIIFIENLNLKGENILADNDKIRRALVNLINNAIQASEKKGDIFVETKFISKDISDQSTKTVEVSIKDKGEGISGKNIKYIFRPFFTTRQEGTGLGLPIVKQIAEDHGGTIDIESKEDVGTKITIRFPQKKVQKYSGDESWSKYKNTEL